VVLRGVRGWIVRGNTLLLKHILWRRGGVGTRVWGRGINQGYDNIEWIVLQLVVGDSGGT